MSPARVAVVGLGVAGTTVALLLARQGHHVTLFEQTPEPGPVGAGVLLQPSGQLVLTELGLLDAIAADAEPIHHLHALTHRGHVLVHLPYSQLGPGIHALGVRRGTLFTALHQELQRTPATIRLGIRATTSQSNQNSVTLADDHHQPLGDFDFILACDGARSALRAGSNLPVHLHEYPHGALWATGICSHIRNHLFQITHGSRRLCGLLPTGNGHCTLFWSLDKKDHPAHAAAGFKPWRDQVLRLCPQATEIFESLDSLDQVKYTTYVHVRMLKPFTDRCLFLGDAAHAMSPHLGQGINLALIDAWCFAHAAAQSHDFPEACRRYTQTRRAHLRVYSAITYLLSPFFQSPGAVKGLLRDLALPLMPKFPTLRRHMTLTMAGLRHNWLGQKFSLPK